MGFVVYMSVTSTRDSKEKSMEEKMEADSILLPDGTKSDAALYEDSLNDPFANLYADLAAAKAMIDAGMDPQAAIEVCGIEAAVLAVAGSAMAKLSAELQAEIKKPVADIGGSKS